MMMGEALQECLSRFPKMQTLHGKQREALEDLLSGRNVAIQVLKASRSPKTRLSLEKKLGAQRMTRQLALNLLYALCNLRVKKNRRKISFVVVVQANSKVTFHVRGLSFAILDTVN